MYISPTKGSVLGTLGTSLLTLYGITSNSALLEEADTCFRAAIAVEVTSLASLTIKGGFWI